MRVLRLGDPHVKPANLEESERLMQFVLDYAMANNVDTIEILGDLFHTHLIIRLEVLEFWKKWLWKFSESFVTIVLVGNHDQSGNHNSKMHALSVFTALNPDKLWIIDLPAVIKGIGYLPYIHNNEEFVKEANTLADLGATFLVSHTTYDGSTYDNGMYAPDGCNSALIDQRLSTLLSGHVHTEQTFGRVVYPGTARWDTASDANKRKGIWLCSHARSSSPNREGYVSPESGGSKGSRPEEKVGVLLDRTFISTGSGVCTPIISIEWREGEEAPQIPEGAKVSVELIGTSSWISQEKDKLKGQVQIRTQITDTKKPSNRQATASFLDYLEKGFFTTGINKKRLLEFAKEIGLV